MNILKRIGAVLGGFMAAMVVVMLFEWLGAYVNPMPKDIDYHDPKALADMMNHMPMTAYLWLLLGYVVASIVGGAVATLLSGRSKSMPALIVGAVLTLGGIINFIMLPHALWFMIVSTLMYIPMALLGYRLCVKQ